MYNLANLLTLSRIVAIPVIVTVFYVPGATAAWIALAVYTLAAVTDFFDGYVARQMNQMSAFGKFLDPIADKLLVGVVLFLLVAFDRLNGYWMIAGLVILMREILIAGLREFLGPYNVQLPVSRLAKWKTTVQMLAIGFLIVGDYGRVLIPASVEIGQILLVVAALLTVVTGWDYLKAGYAHIKALDSR